MTINQHSTNGAAANRQEHNEHPIQPLALALPTRFHRITTVEVHTSFEPPRIFTAGLPELPGETVLEKHRYFLDHYDHIRTATMWEPRGHADMYGAVITPSRDADLDVFFLPTRATAPCADTPHRHHDARLRDWPDRAHG